MTDVLMPPVESFDFPRFITDGAGVTVDITEPLEDEPRTPPMDPARKAEWVAALRSGDYPQGKNTLRTASDEFCCLGVKCDLAVKNGIIPEPRLTEDGSEYYYVGHETSMLPDAVRDWAGLADWDPTVTIDGRCAPVSHWNDTGKTFAEIADAIEAQL